MSWATALFFVYTSSDSPGKMLLTPKKKDKKHKNLFQDLLHAKKKNWVGTVLPAKNNSEIMFCLHSYQGLRIDRSLVYRINTQVIY